MTTLGQRIREHRRRAGMSQEALARQLDVSRQAVTKWESGQSAPSTENLFRLAELFHTTVDLLLPPGEASPAASARPRPDWRHRAEMTGLVLAGYLIFYLLGRVLWQRAAPCWDGWSGTGPAGTGVISTAGCSAAACSGGPWPSPS